MSDSVISSNSSDAKALDFVREDQTLNRYLTDTSEEESAALVHDNAVEDISKVANAVELLTQELHSIVCDHYEELIVQATKLDTLQDDLLALKKRIDALLEVLDRFKTKFGEPYNRIAHRIVLLKRLKITCDLLRKVIRVIHLSKRLQQSNLFEESSSVATRELSKCAQHIAELEALFSDDAALMTVEVIQGDISSIRETKEKLIKTSDRLLTDGIQKQDSGMVHNAFQVFSYLGMLEEKIDAIAKQRGDNLMQAIKDTFDVRTINPKSQGPGGVAISITSGQNSTFRKNLWEKFEGIIKMMFSNFGEIQLLQRALKKKRESNVNLTFEQSLSSNKLSTFYSDMSASLLQHMNKSSHESSVFKEAFESEYPRMMRLFNELWTKTGVDGSELSPHSELRNALNLFESAYLSRSLSGLFDRVNIIFTDSVDIGKDQACPSSEDIKTVIGNMSNELNLANVDHGLLLAMVKNVSKAIQLLVVKFEQLVRVDGDATQVIGPRTASQDLNCNIVKRLVEFRAKMNSFLESDSYAPGDLVQIKESLHRIDPLIQNTVEPLMASVRDAVEAIILTLHNENFSSSLSSDTQCSLYMRELQEFITRVQTDYFVGLPDDKLVHQSFTNVAGRTIELFMRHSTLLRPLPESARLRLAADYAQLEMALAPLCQKLGDLGKPYRALRAFKPFLFQDEATISASPAVGGLIPYSIVLQYLISCYGPPELKSPHENRGWSISRYTTWLDEHTEREKLFLIGDSVDAYVRFINDSQAKSFAPVYSVIVRLLQQGLQSEP